ncbi:MAG: hypothetical protein ACLFVO_08480 [Chloroflexaceae bacterium]|jgi:hypothetical protein
MQALITNLLLLVIASGIGYLVAQWRPHWFRVREMGGTLLPGLIVALLLAAALRAAAVVYGPGAMFSIISVIGGLVLGIWLAQRTTRTQR